MGIFATRGRWISCWRPFSPQEGPKSTQEDQEAPRAPQEAPRERPQEAARGLRERFWSNLGDILEAKIDDFRSVFSARCGGCFWTCCFGSCSSAGALKLVLFGRGAKRPPKQIHWNTKLFTVFQCSRACRGRREDGTRGSN